MATVAIFKEYTMNYGTVCFNPEEPSFLFKGECFFTECKNEEVFDLFSKHMTSIMQFRGVPKIPQIIFSPTRWSFYFFTKDAKFNFVSDEEYKQLIELHRQQQTNYTEQQ